MRAPIGIDDFKKLIDTNSTFIDKTLLIDELLDTSTEVTLFTRPRRFGKSLNLSMMRYFFDNKEDSSYLFKDLKIANTLNYKYLNQYPVINLSFKDAKGDYNSIIKCIYEKLNEAYNVDTNTLNEENLNKYNLLKKELLKDCDFNLIRVSNSISFLTEILCKIYNKKVILLIDEYDAPIINAINSNCYDDSLRNFISILYSSCLKGNVYLERAILTGIQRVAKENIFSGLNNIKVNTVLDENLDEYFGFTSSETKLYLSKFNLELNDDVKNMYDGYKFGNTEIYNPWSIINYADNKVLIPYWVNTASNTLLKEYLLKSSEYFKESFNELIIKDEVEVNVDISLNVFEGNIEDKYLWGLFLNSGYITIKEVTDLFEGVYIVKIPNKEVRKEINDLFVSLLNINTPPDIFRYLIEKDYKKFIDRYKNFILNNTSFHDHSKVYENSYHMFTLGMLFSRIVGFNIYSNKECGHGRVDILCESKGSKPHLIFEFKVGSDPSIAIKQIHDNNYYSNLSGNILLIGIAYDKKDCYIEVEEINR